MQRISKADQASFDVFISYTRRHHERDASLLADYLTAKGYSVWFDRAVLEDRLDYRRASKESVAEILTEAISKSRCVVAFEYSQLRFDASINVDAAIEARQAIRLDDGRVIAWSWAQFEQRTARDLIHVGTLDFESIYSSLVGRGIEPRRLSWDKRLLNSFNVRLSRLRTRMRLHAKLEVIRPPVRYVECQNFSLAEASIFLSGILVVSGPGGSGRSTLVSALLARMKESVIQLRNLPSLVDLDIYSQKLVDCAAKTILVDDFGDLLFSYPRREWSATRVLFDRLLLADKRIVLVTTPQQTNILLSRRDRSYDPWHWEGLNVRVQWMKQLTQGELSELLSTWSAEGESTISDDAEDLLLECANRISLRRDGKAVEYKTLAGDLVGGLGAMRRVWEESRAACRSRERTVVDEADVIAAIRKLTGLSWVIELMLDRRIGSKCPEFDTAVNLLCQRLGIDGASELSSHLNCSALDSPRVRCVAVSARRARHELARELAILVYGSADALIWIDYEASDEQQLDATSPTEVATWAFRTLSRWPFFVVLLEGLAKAPRKDINLWRTVFDEELSGENDVFQNCILLVDDQCQLETLSKGYVETVFLPPGKGHCNLEPTKG